MSLGNWLRRRGPRWPWLPEVPVFYDEAYRLPLTGIESAVGIELRAVDFTTWYLLDTGTVRPTDIRRPLTVGYGELARVHDAAYLESLGRPETLARIYAADPSEIPVDTLLSHVRLVCGGTLGATRLALSRKGPVVNMAGGYHHAGPSRGGGFCAVNDLAVALAAVREEGFDGQAVVLDLDAHPPDGTAACLEGQPRAWVGSLSGSDWGALPAAVDETRVPEGAGDTAYLSHLEGLLSRMPRPGLAFVIAGGDVLAGDRFGRVGLTLEGARRRDMLLARALKGVPSVWLPGGGYHSDSWKVFAGTVLVLTGRGSHVITARYDPLSARFQRVARLLRKEEEAYEEQPLTLTLEDLEGSVSYGGGQQRVLGYYTAQALEYALYRYGLLSHLERVGYQHARVEVGSTGAGDRIKVLGESDGREHLLVDVVLERKELGGEPFLFVNWLNLRHPRASFSERRPQLPGQDVPGLGLSREATEMFLLMANRLDLAGIAFRPMWYHLAVVARARLRFVDPARQGRFEALMRDLAHVPLLEATRAMAEGRILLNGEPYRWEPDDMVLRLRPAPDAGDADAIAAERERCHFTGEPAS